ncbi:BREX-1 system adenine-specific DNA-methyltransferase PglX [Lacticaseibacillus paracasei]|nr:BREX-1 system adenine-specific DNA-methyltransferase PglX [Lacticaseibacillus paracasei]QTH69247.1 BREX-1 system adenine-specific DNA-methyltransferase PglX [Lacticaseibacillus paracasei]
MFTPSYSSGVIKDLVDDIKEDDFDVDEGGQVEIIGWLYQYYNIEPHDKVVNINGGPIKTNDIPAATQLFTTDWVVRYMVDNSLGRLYLEYFPDSPIKEKLFYLLPGPIEERTDSFDLSKLKVLDDAMGSGHILVYAFDLLIRMYEEQGYGKRDATDAILAHNLYGLEIDKRAYQLAYFALMMKARQYNRRILSKPIRHNLHVFESTVDVPNEVFEKINASKDTIDDLHTLVSIFRQAKLLGSIMHFEKKFDFDALFCAVNSLPDSTQLDLFGLQAAKNTLQSILRIAQVLQTHFDVVATNPPYLNRMNGDLKKYVKKYYKAYSGDLFSVFIWKNIEMTKQDGYSAYMTPFVWMFIKTYEGLRKSILDSKQISSLIQMEYSAFEEATVPINTFVLKNDMNADATGTYLKLSDFKGGMEVQKKYVLTAIADPSVGYLYRTKQTNFEKIPGRPVAYWASNKLINDFEIGSPLQTVADPKVGLQTGNNSRFLRQWFEIVDRKIYLVSHNPEFSRSQFKWFPYTKGGSYRKWYGNYDYVINWEKDGHEIRHYFFPNGKRRSVIRNPDYYFKEAVTWSEITSGSISFRYVPNGFIFDQKGPGLFIKKKTTSLNNRVLLGWANSRSTAYILSLLAPTLDFSVGPVGKTPFLYLPTNKNKEVSSIVGSCISISKEDWNSLETSIFFNYFPLLLIAEHQKSPTTKLLIFFDFCDKYVPIQFRGLIFYGKLSKKR